MLDEEKAMRWAKEMPSRKVYAVEAEERKCECKLEKSCRDCRFNEYDGCRKECSGYDKFEYKHKYCPECAGKVGAE